jgi:hypothetical protein
MASFFSASADTGELPPRGDKPQDGEATISIESAAKFIEAASSCLNDKDGPEFVAGIQAAFMPLHSAVMKAAGEDLGYGDVIHKYAILNRNNPKTGIHALLQLADAMYAAPACGVRFVVGHLMLTYMGQGAVRSDRPVVQTMPLVFMHTEKAVEILRIAQKWA